MTERDLARLLLILLIVMAVTMWILAYVVLPTYPGAPTP